MDNKRLLIAPQQSPYRVLGTPFDIDAKDVNKAFRAFFRKNPKMAARAGKTAQKRLTDPKERIKADVFCVEVSIPQIDLTDLKDNLSPDEQFTCCPSLENKIVFSDLYCSNKLRKPLETDVVFEDLEYRSEYAEE